MPSVDSLFGWYMGDFIIKGLVNDSSVLNPDFRLWSFAPSHSMLHPFLVVSVWEVISSMSSSRFFSVFSGIDGNLCALKKIL